MLLGRAEGPKFETWTVKISENIQKHYDICTEFASSPQWIKLTVGSNELNFNREVWVDAICLNACAIISMMDEATHFCSASFLQKQSRSELWWLIQQLKHLVYLDPSEFFI